MSIGHRKIMGHESLGLLGSGARTTIHHVVASGSDRALKHLVIRSDADRRFLVQMRHEHAIARRISHPGIRKTLRLKIRRRLFRTVEAGLLMEFVAGGTLEQDGDRSPVATVDCFTQVAEALASLHRRGWVHADVKPTNIVCSDDGAVLIDLGQATGIGTTKERVQGTPGFMAPEQALREPITPQTDVYGLGATFYWVLTGRTVPTVITGKSAERGIRGMSDLEQARAPVPLTELRPELSRSLSDLIQKCVAPSPARRFTGMPDLIGALSRIRGALDSDGASDA